MPRAVRLLAALVVVMLVGSCASVGVVLHQQGYRLYVVHTGSMSPTYQPGDVVLDQPAAHVQAGQVITFRHSAQTTDVVTHRITDVTAAGIHTKGDANASPDVWDIRPDQVQGVVTDSIPRLGYLLVFFQQPAGVGAAMTAFLAVLLLWRLFFPAAPKRPALA